MTPHVWGGAWASVTINVWLCRSNSLMCIDSCCSLFIASETTLEYYESKLIIAWVCRPLILRSWSTSPQPGHRQISCIFYHGIDWLRKICSHMSPTFPLIQVLYLILFVQLIKSFRCTWLIRRISLRCRQCIFFVYVYPINIPSI